eukprot:8787985-Lingulodinium_polyedra.AAC.1
MRCACARAASSVAMRARTCYKPCVHMRGRAWDEGSGIRGHTGTSVSLCCMNHASPGACARAASSVALS